MNNESINDVTISVIMGTYNGRYRIAKAVESIKEQTFNNWELLICDDCSTDDTLHFLLEKYSDNAKIKILHLQKNSGLAAALNECLKHAKGKYIARMDDDDYSHPNRFEKQLKFIDSHPGFKIFGTSINYMDDDGIYGCDVFEEKEVSKNRVFKGNCFVHPTIIMERQALLSVGGYTDSLETLRGEDYDLWCKLYSKGYKGINSSEILFDYYENKNSIKRRKFKYDYLLFRNKLKWRRHLNLPFYFIIYAYRCLLVASIPQPIYVFLRRIKVKS